MEEMEIDQQQEEEFDDDYDLIEFNQTFKMEIFSDILLNGDSDDILLLLMYLVSKRDERKRIEQIDQTEQIIEQIDYEQINNQLVDQTFNEKFSITNLKNDYQFQSFICITETDFEYLLSLVAPIIQKKTTNWNRKPISPSLRLFVTLRYLVSGELYSELSFRFDMSKQVISKIVPDVCHALTESLCNYIKCPTTPTEWSPIIAKFRHLHNFPNCAAVVGVKPVPHHSGAYNIYLMIVVDANGRLLFIKVGQYESIRKIFTNSSFYQKLVENKLGFPKKTPLLLIRNSNNSQPKTGVPHVVVSDIELSKNILKPYPCGLYPAGSPEDIYNRQLARLLSIVYRGFESMTNTFRAIQNQSSLKVNNVGIVVMAISHLYNFRRRDRKSRTIYSIEDTPGSGESILPTNNIPVPDNYNYDNEDYESKRIRNQFRNYFYYIKKNKV